MFGVFTKPLQIANVYTILDVKRVVEQAHRKEWPGEFEWHMMEHVASLSTFFGGMLRNILGMQFAIFC